MTSPPSPPASRFHRVRAILDAAAGTSTADYDGHGRFWNLPYAEFIDIKIYGVQMIAPTPTSTSVACDGEQPASPEPDTAPAAGCHHCSDADEAKDANDPVGNDDSDRYAACHDPQTPQPAPNQPAHPGQGAVSGLIKGLRGQHPFTGRHLPRLPWGGSAVANQDIRFIASWIDDGCPEHDDPVHQDADPTTAMADSTNSLTAMAALSIHPRVASSQEFKTRRNDAIQRKNVEFLTDDELCKLRYAIAELKKLNQYNDYSPTNGRRRFDRRSYDNWARIHADTCTHGWEMFLPWHRMYLYDFEQALRDIVPDVALMYWDWTMPRYQQGRTGEIPDAFKCWLDAAALNQLDGKIENRDLMDKLTELEGQKFNSINRLLLVANGQGDELPNGSQAERMKKFRAFVDPLRKGKNDYQAIVAALGAVNSLWCALRFPGEFYIENAMSSCFHHHYPTADDIDNIIHSINNFRDFGGGSAINQSYGALDVNAHNTIHIWSGGYDLSFPRGKHQVNGDMLANLTAAWDPIFWGHHGNVDRIWQLWQAQHPGLGPADLDATIAPFSYKIANAMSIERLGYEYVANAIVFQSDRRVAFSHYQTDPSDCPTHLLGDACCGIEVRIHDFIQPNDSCFIRVFLNQPDANTDTPTIGNPNFVGQIAVFGHGPCVGGPGHCDAPAARTRTSDLRPPDHNTPWNYRLDATTCLHELRENGADNVQVNLVAIAADGHEAPELLRFDALSLNFTD